MAAREFYYTLPEDLFIDLNYILFIQVTTVQEDLA